MTNKAQKSEGLLSFVSMLIKKSAEIPSDIQTLAASVKILADQITILSKNVVKLSRVSQEHTEAIDQIATIQAYILQTMKTTSTDTKLPDIHVKVDKPN